MTWLIPLAMAAEGAAHHEGASHGGLAAAAVINFVLLAVAIVYLARKPLAQTFLSKHDTLKKELAEAESLRKSVEQMFKDYKGKLDRLDLEVAAILNEAKAEGEKEKKIILERAQRLAEKIKHDALLAADKERDHMKISLEKETLAEASKKAIELLRSRVTDKDHRAFTNELIESLEQTTHG